MRLLTKIFGNFFYRSCVKDCIQALNLNPDYEKCKIRLARCYLNLSKFAECIKICSEIQNNTEIAEIKAKCTLNMQVIFANCRFTKLKLFFSKKLYDNT